VRVNPLLVNRLLVNPLLVNPLLVNRPGDRLIPARSPARPLRRTCLAGGRRRWWPPSPLSRTAHYWRNIFKHATTTQ